MSTADERIKGQTAVLASDYGELVLDAMLEDGLAKDVPVVGTMFKAVSIVDSLRDKYFQEKVRDLLREVSKAPKAEREHFTDELVKKHGTRQKAGHAILHMIDRLDDLSKPELVGRIYLARIQNKITHEEMLRFCMVVERAFLPDLEQLRGCQFMQEIAAASAPMLESLGLAAPLVSGFGFASQP